MKMPVTIRHGSFVPEQNPCKLLCWKEQEIIWKDYLSKNIKKIKSRIHLSHYSKSKAKVIKIHNILSLFFENFILVYSVYFICINSLLLPPLPGAPPTQFYALFDVLNNPLVFYNPLSLITAVCRNGCGASTIPLKRADSFSPLSTISNYSGGVVAWGPFPLHTGILTDLILCTFCVGNHSAGGFRGASPCHG